jgi:hypothetical protein
VPGQDQGERYRDLTVVDEELRRRGLVVDHACNDMSLARRGDYEAVFVNVKIVPHCLAGTVRMVGHLSFQFWNSIGVRKVCEHQGFPLSRGSGADPESCLFSLTPVSFSPMEDE